MAIKPLMCRACFHELEPGKAQCSNCRTWNIAVAKPETRLVSLAETDDTDTLRITKDQWWASLMGGGLPEGCSILMGGEPGAGKSTFALQLSLACILETKKPVLYLATEMSRKAIKPYARRLGFRPDTMAYMAFLIDPVDQELNCLEDVGGVGLSLAVLDSLPHLAGQNEQMAVDIICKLDDWCIKTGVPVLILDHVTKGKELAGMMALQHLVGMTAYLREHPGKPTRTWTTHKNRFGPGQVSLELCMTPEGIVPFVAPETTEESKPLNSFGSEEKIPEKEY